MIDLWIALAVGLVCGVGAFVQGLVGFYPGFAVCLIGVFWSIVYTGTAGTRLRPRSRFWPHPPK